MSSESGPDQAWHKKWAFPLWLGAGFACFLLGVLAHAGLKEPLSPSDIVYRTVQLFFWDGGVIGERISEYGTSEMLYEIARFGAGTLAAAAIIAGFRGRLINLRDRLRGRLLWRRHVVVLGLGYRGAALVRQLCVSGRRVIALELDANNPEIAKARKLGAAVVIGDMTDADEILDTGVLRATHVVAISASDEDNLSAMAIIKDHRGTRREPRGLVHLSELSSWPAVCPSYRLSTDQKLFNVDELTVAELLNAQPPFVVTPIKPIALVGDGQRALIMLAVLAKRWQLFRSDHEQLLPVSVIGPDAEDTVAMAIALFERIDTMLELTAEQTTTHAPAAAVRIIEPLAPEVVYVVTERSEDAIGLAAGMIPRLSSCRFGIRVDGTPATLDASCLCAPAGAPAAQVVVIDAQDVFSETESLLDDSSAHMAIAAHDDYRRRKSEELLADPGAEVTVASQVSWERLEDRFKMQNQSQAEDVLAALESCGYSATSLLDWDAERFELTPDEVEALADREHERWMRVMLAPPLSYKDAPELRHPDPEKWQGTDHERSRTPYLVPFDQLPRGVQDYDRGAVRNYPWMLALVGQRPVDRIEACAVHGE